MDLEKGRNFSTLDETWTPCNNGQCLREVAENTELEIESVKTSWNPLYKIPKIGAVLRSDKLIKLNHRAERNWFAAARCREDCPKR